MRPCQNWRALVEETKRETEPLGTQRPGGRS
jgi:hypothetical protein